MSDIGFAADNAAGASLACSPRVLDALNAALARPKMQGFSLIRRWKPQFAKGLVASLVMLFAVAVMPCPAAALDQVSLQLKWKHQFQFAGYYAAIEKGFYRDHGLEVEIRDGGPGVDAGTEVAYGAAEFGVCTTSVLTDSIERANNVVIGVIFQHSAAIIMVPYRAGIHAISELKGRRLMDTPGSDDVAAMLKREGGGLQFGSGSRVSLR